MPIKFQTPHQHGIHEMHTGSMFSNQVRQVIDEGVQEALGGRCNVKWNKGKQLSNCFENNSQVRIFHKLLVVSEVFDLGLWK